MIPAPQDRARQHHIGDLGDHLGRNIQHAQSHRRTPPPAQQDHDPRPDRLAKAGREDQQIVPASRVIRAIKL
jgi:hypothetical protein